MDGKQPNVVNFFLGNDSYHQGETSKTMLSTPVNNLNSRNPGLSTIETIHDASNEEMRSKQPKMLNPPMASELPPPTLDNPYLPYSAIAVRQQTPIASSQAGGLFYNQKPPYRGDLYSMYLTQETVAPNPPMPIPYKPMQPSPIMFYPSYGQHCYPPLPPNQQSTPILSPYFNQTPFPPYPAHTATNPMVPSTIFPLSTSGIPNSSLPSVQHIPAPPLNNDLNVKQKAPQEDYREMKLTRDRAAARLRRMRKKASIETTELRIDVLKSFITTLQNASITENRQGLFIPFEIGESLLYSSEERLNHYQFLLMVWQTLFKRQKRIHSIVGLLLWTLIPDNASAPHEQQRLQLRDALKLSETQQQRILSLIHSFQHLERQINITSACLIALGVHTNILLNPLVDRGNELFLSIFTSSQIQKLHSFFRINDRTISKLPVTFPESVPDTDVPVGLSFDFSFCVCFAIEDKK